jgi:PAS domain S-box-containing protein
LKELREQLLGALLVILTVAAVVAAALNFQQQRRYHLPDDGVTWQDVAVPGRQKPDVTARLVVSDGPAAKAGVHEGDVVEAIASRTITGALDVPQVLEWAGPWRNIEYQIRRGSGSFTAKVIVGEVLPDMARYFQYVVGIVYLAVGLFVYFRRGGAPRSVHFYLLCLLSFVFSTFHYTGKLNNFDKVIYWGNVVAGALAPALFLHFTLAFPEKARWLRGRMRSQLLYLPALVLIGLYVAVAFGFAHVEPQLEARWILDRGWLLIFCASYLIGGAVLALRVRAAEDPIVRRQLTWLRNGAIAGVLPFTAMYVVPYVAGVVPTQWMSLSILFLILVPLTWAWAILRYRLMDVDIIFQQGYVYTLATLCVLGVFYGLLFSFSKAGDLSGTALVALVLIATFIFQPIRNWMQEVLDRHIFYRDRYNYRQTLIEFARELGTQTDTDAMLESVADRLINTLFIRQVAFFLWDDARQQFRMHSLSGRSGRLHHYQPADDLDLSFLTPQPGGRPYLFFERTRGLLNAVSSQLPTSIRRAVSELQLTYYLPCNARGRTIAWLGVSRTEDDDFLSSDDVELLLTLAGYVGIAIENANLYRSLERKAEEFERLKEYSENIVESINVGVLAVDLEDRVESWNSQIEHLCGVPRENAMGRRLCELFPEELCDQFELLRGEPGVHHLAKVSLKEPRETIVNVAIAPLVSKEGERIGRLIIFDDITDRDELERRLVQADKLSSIGLLAAGVAHEVNTPLAVISTYAQMLAKQINGDEKKAALLEKISKQTFRASEIVNSLLNFSRTWPVEFVDVDLNKTVREAVNLVDHQLEKAGVRIEMRLQDPLPPIRGHSGKLQQVLLNLILNARDAMEGGGQLTVETEERDGTVHLTVSDTGSGISAENLQRIFDPFFTTKGATKKGTGLGLSVSYGIIREHGGDIEVRSVVGHGTRFDLEFPLRRPLTETAAEAVRSAR